MPWKPDYVTLSAMKTFVNIADAVDDAEIQEKITAASRAIDDHCNRQFGQVAAPVARVYESASWDPVSERWLVTVDDIQDVTGLTVQVGATTITGTGYTLAPRNALADGKPYEYLRLADRPADVVTVTARFGWTAVPAGVVTATKLQANRWLERRQSPYGIAGSPEQGSEVRLLSRVDPDVAVVLRGLGRPRKAA